VKTTKFRFIGIKINLTGGELCTRDFYAAHARQFVPASPGARHDLSIAHTNGTYLCLANFVKSMGTLMNDVSQKATRYRSAYDPARM